MKIYFILLSIIFPSLVHAGEIDCENTIKTREMNICSSMKVDAANIILEKYLAKAQERYAQETAAIDLLNKSQDAWVLYQKAYCDAIYELWSDGSIRGVMLAGVCCG